MQDPGDFGRRLATRRTELELTFDDLASRTGMAVPYLRHLEADPDARPDLRAVAKLARALNVTTSYLLGTGANRPPGSGSAEPNARIVQLEEDECWDLIARGGVGRLVFDSDRGPTAEPVNFRVLPPRSIVNRTESDTHIAGLAGADPVGFEVDHIDEAMSTGWSVFLTGAMRRADDVDELEVLRGLDVSPWAGGSKDAYMVLEVSETTGRRIELDS